MKDQRHKLDRARKCLLNHANANSENLFLEFTALLAVH